MKSMLLLSFILMSLASCSSSTDISTFDVVITRNAEAKTKEDMASCEKDVEKLRANVGEIKRIRDDIESKSLFASEQASEVEATKVSH